jgi:uncharacterized protein (UPF0335 family)
MSENTASSQIKSFVERYETLLSERATIDADLSVVLAEVKEAGFDKAAFKKLIAKRAKDKTQVQEQDALVDLYANALGDA